MYEKRASKISPGLIIFIVDVSASMEKFIDSQRRIDKALEVVHHLIERMVHLSIKGSQLVDRYRIALFTNGDSVQDIFEGVKNLTEVVNSEKINTIKTENFSNISSLFETVLTLLESEIKTYSMNSPAPLVVHISDGSCDSSGVETIIKKIMSLSVPDGKVLMANILITDTINTDKINKYYSISSEIPEQIINRLGITIEKTNDHKNSMVYSDGQIIKYCLPLSDVS